jgi:hypothetical protein
MQLAFAPSLFAIPASWPDRVVLLADARVSDVISGGRYTPGQLFPVVRKIDEPAPPFCSERVAQAGRVPSSDVPYPTRRTGQTR